MARILITNFHPVGGGGHVPYIKALTKINQRSKHVVGVATPGNSRIHDTLTRENFAHLYSCDFPAKIQKELPSIIKNIAKFRAIVEDFKPDIVHVNGGPDLFITLWSHPIPGKFKIIRTHHAIKHIGNDFYHHYIYSQRISENIYVSKSAFSISTASGLTPKNHSVIENGVDLKVFTPADKDAELVRKYGITDDTLCFGSCAGTGHYKRVDVIIRAAATLKSSSRPFKILALGDESSGKKLTALAKSLNVTQFKHCGFQKDVVAHTSLFDVGFILSDAIETVSFAAREMMAMGKPLLSSSFSGLSENVLNGENGYLVEPGDIEGTAEAMQRFLNMPPQTLKEFSLSAREFAELNFDINTQIDAHIDLYQRVENL